MNVACPGCGTKYALLDEKVRGRRVRITCKHCSAAIVVDGTVTSPQPETKPTASPVQPGASKLAPTMPRAPAVAAEPQATARSTPLAPDSESPTLSRSLTDPAQASAPKPKATPIASAPGTHRAGHAPRRSTKPASDEGSAKHRVAPLATAAAAATSLEKPDDSMAGAQTHPMARLSEKLAAAGIAHAPEQSTSAAIMKTSEKLAAAGIARSSESAATASSTKIPGKAAKPSPAAGARTTTPTAAPLDGAAPARGTDKPAATGSARTSERLPATTPIDPSVHESGAAKRDADASGEARSALAVGVPEQAKPGRAVAPNPLPGLQAGGVRPATRGAAPRPLRGTIIGVAEPANAPLHAPGAHLAAAPAAQLQVHGASAVVPGRAPAMQVPSGAALSSPSTPPPPAGLGSTAVAVATTALENPNPNPLPAPATLSPKKPARGLHRTIIGVAAPATPGEVDLGAMHQRSSVRIPSLRVVPPTGGDASPPAALGVSPAQRRAPAARLDLKRTIIGGLEAPSPMLAPAPAAATQQLSPSQTKWLVLFPKQGTAEMTEAELVRAFATGKLTGEANVWREGMREWQPLEKVEALKPLLLSGGVSTAPPPRPVDGVERPSDSAKPEVVHVETQRPQRSSFDHEQPTLRQAPTLRPAQAEQPEQPVATASEQSAAAAEQSSPPTKRLGRERFDSQEITRIAPSPWDVPDVGAKATAKLAENAGLPPRQMSLPPRQRQLDDVPLERPSKRPDIGPRATVRGQLAALASSAPPARVNVGQPRDLEASANSELGDEPKPPPEAASAALEMPPVSANATKPAAKRRITSRAWFWVCLLGAVLALVVGSYRARQPKALYAFMHRHAWDVPVDRAVQRVAPKLGYATDRYLKRPYRAAVEKLRHNHR